MSLMFFEATNFNNGEASGESTKPLEWNTSKAFNFKQMFNKASSFNQPIGDWQTGFIRDMYGMFAGANVFNQNISGWNTSGVINMGSMFNQAYAFNQNIGGWNTGAVTNMSSMFRNATVFNNGDKPGVSSKPLNWNTIKVKDMSYMFQNANVFVGINDVGKSNILKALNLFFNGQTDYSNGFSYESDFTLPLTSNLSVGLGLAKPIFPSEVLLIVPATKFSTVLFHFGTFPSEISVGLFNLPSISSFKS